MIFAGGQDIRHYSWTDGAALTPPRLRAGSVTSARDKADAAAEVEARGRTRRRRTPVRHY